MLEIHQMGWHRRLLQRLLGLLVYGRLGLSCDWRNRFDIPIIGPGQVTQVAVYLVILSLSIIRVSEGTLQCS
jgi:hypothetical protein